MLYFAYGSNLHHLQMRRRCKHSVYLKKINLKNFRLTFRSKYRAADIEPKKNSIVPGGLLEISTRFDPKPSVQDDDSSQMSDSSDDTWNSWRKYLIG